MKSKGEEMNESAFQKVIITDSIVFNIIRSIEFEFSKNILEIHKELSLSEEYKNHFNECKNKYNKLISTINEIFKQIYLENQKTFIMEANKTFCPNLLYNLRRRKCSIEAYLYSITIEEFMSIINKVD